MNGLYFNCLEMSKLLADFLSPPIYTNLYGFVPRMDAIWTPRFPYSN